MPSPGGFDDFLDALIRRHPAQALPGALGAGDQRGRVAGAAGFDGVGNGLASDAAGHLLRPYGLIRAAPYGCRCNRRHRKPELISVSCQEFDRSDGKPYMAAIRQFDVNA